MADAKIPRSLIRGDVYGRVSSPHFIARASSQAPRLMPRGCKRVEAVLSAGYRGPQQ